MTTQKTLKRRIRARADKTGESYTVARAQLLRKAEPPAPEPDAVEPDAVALTGMTDDKVRSGSGRPIGEWLAILDAWGAPGRTHTEIARWLRTEQGVDGWWAQSVTVAYERARGIRAKHQKSDGFYATVTRTVDGTPERASDAFTSADLRARWLPDAPMRPRTATRGRSARFDWDDPPSRLIVGFVSKGEGKSQVSISHERLADAESTERMRTFWRERLDALKGLLAGS